jgi:hypothetical protein
MAKAKPAEIVGKIVDLLSPFKSEERGRVISAVLTLLGEVGSKHNRDKNGSFDDDDHHDTPINSSGKVKSWQKQNGVTGGQLAQMFHITDGKAEVIAGEMPGKNKKEQTLNAYVLAGVAQFISTGEPKFTDKDARSLCVAAGCYDSANHAVTLKAKGNWFTGSKDKGWVLTAPGLKHAATLLKTSTPD